MQRGRFSIEYIPYKGREENVEVLVSNLWQAVDNHENILDDIISLKSFAEEKGLTRLADELNQMTMQIYRKLSNDPMAYTIAPVAMDENNARDINEMIPMPEPKRKHEPRKMFLSKNKIYMTQFIELTYKDGWYKSTSNEDLTLEDVNYWFKAILKYDFDGQSGALSCMYTDSEKRWSKLSETLYDLAQKEHNKRLKT